ncbi:SMP-30/gluconolactonase/LRE family protein [Enterococcus sp. HY326]|uniref:SMP-30/gluconolactonase/LRE family protein n=1 Tax=Enterococcus sp. HY326 TaxID=2971265 RepID=UPI00223EFFE4|nr:SMP-30/gluconolactonase/LRE family protein [Enterococcus sp. HY326]
MRGDKFLQPGLLPNHELTIPYQVAEPWFKVSDQQMQLEGLCFDRKGDLYFVDVFGGEIYCLQLPEKQLTQIALLENQNPAALKIHRDGRLFICCLGDMESTGSVLAMQPDGSGLETIVDASFGFVIDDLIFDEAGGFYFTDFKGYSCNPIGGVYYVSADYQKITQVMGNMAVPNGVALNPTNDGLWTTEMSNNRLHFWSLAEDHVTIPAYGSAVPYHFSGLEGPDSICIDALGNLYVAMYMQGRVLVFNPEGIPIEQIFLPERIQRQMLRSTSVAVYPEQKQLVICSNDGSGDGGSWLYHAKSFAVGHKNFQFQ